jgi:phosphoglycolate phosphatase-like HAD superfamily hydrolase
MDNNDLILKNRLLLWDIDGTLVRTNRPNSSNPHLNTLLKFGYSVSTDLPELSGCTDYEVIIELLKKAKISVNKFTLRKIFREIDKEAHQLDKISEFKLCPGVQNILDTLNTKKWTHGILTGNTNSRMISKLLSSNILDYFLKDLMFSCNFGESREDISKNARIKIKKEVYQKIYMIGDTPKDIFAARSAGFPIISVASGSYSLLDLSHHNPDLLIQNLEVDSNLLIDYLSK